ncbi:MAG: NAD(P)/FAD-dependent oxidoreductase, partial [Bacteroidales bacterium]|nr:NAD(P)/FAD-dependent oxidoreductase [Bacteroidales bacterium]
MKEFEIAEKIGRELSEASLKEAAAKALGVKVDNVGHVEVVRRSIDARQDILYRYRVQAYRKGEEFTPYKAAPYMDVHASEPVIVVGAGPAGMFAALKLLLKGFKPIVLERGKDVERRKVDMARLSVEGVIDPDSNYCYGEGGAGAFSDGKLFTRSSKRGDIREVLHQLVAFGAHPDILIDAHPHIGTDRLPEIVKNIRKCIEDHGGEYH